MQAKDHDGQQIRAQRRKNFGQEKRVGKCLWHVESAVFVAFHRRKPSMTTRKTKPLVGVLVGESLTPAGAAWIVQTYRHCPYCVSYRSTGRIVIGVFSLPPKRRWWLQWVAEAAEETLGLESAAVAYPQGVKAWSPWSRGEVRPKLKRGRTRRMREDASGGTSAVFGPRNSFWRRE